jgi:DNA-binding SARP family transcriptional activator/predicted ATPase
MTWKIYLLGQFKLLGNDRTFELPSRPAQSLLAYLVLNAGVTHRREKLASLIWPEANETNARSYLRQALWRIGKSLEDASFSRDEYLKISDISVTFDNKSDYWLDVDLLWEGEKKHSLDEMIAIVQLYRGELLPGFYEEWVVLERDRLETAYHQKMNLLLEGLLQAGHWEEALKWSEQWIRLGHLPEAAFRAMLRAHAGFGDQGMLRVTYQRCVEALKRELDLEPSAETKRLYEQILHGEFDSVQPVPLFSRPTERRLPFLDEEDPHQVERPIFVARERELTQLDSFLHQSISGQGRVVFVTGETGCGKTALLQEFAWHAQKNHRELIVTSGNCNAYTGIGDPFLPFREILGLLTGNVEAKWAAEAITREHARRLWHTLPISVQALVDVGPDLIDTFVQRAALLEHASTYTTGRADWLKHLDEFLERKPATVLSAAALHQVDLFEQYTRVLQAIEQQCPLLIMIDDLQWADAGSINLFFHLGRRLSGMRILIVGAFRSEEVSLGRDGVRHPLEPVINEFRREFGDITVNLGQAESRDFVTALLESEPNRMGSPFKEMLYWQTQGHPLFTIELLRGLQERGDIVKDSQGYWVAGASLDWETLPVRVEAAIQERIARLPVELQKALTVASIEGEIFTAEVIAHVCGVSESEMLEHLSGELDRKHRLVRAHSIQRVAGQLLSRYQFRHILFQKFLYNNLDDVVRVHFHEQVGIAMEEVYRSQENEAGVTVQLVRHFEQARITKKAIHYLHSAGEMAVRLSAFQEGIAHLTRELALLGELPESQERDQQELTMQIALAIAWQGLKGAQILEVKNAYTRAHNLCQKIGSPSQIVRVLSGLAILNYVWGENKRALELAKEALHLAEGTEDPLLIHLCHWPMGFILFCMGEFIDARSHLEQVISFYKPYQHHHPLISLRGSDAGLGAMAYGAVCLWCLGYPEQALKRSEEALALAREFGHPFTLADVLCFAGCTFKSLYGDARGLKEDAEELMQLSTERNMAGWLATGIRYRGEALALLGDLEGGIAQMREGLAAMESEDVRMYFSGTYDLLAETQAKTGKLEEGLATLDEAFSLIEKTDERQWEAELYRMKAELLQMQGNEAEVETNLHKAIEIARSQSAKLLELRSTVSLGRLWQKQGKKKKAQEMLDEIYGWFTEGFDTPELQEAKELLDELS